MQQAAVHVVEVTNAAKGTTLEAPRGRHIRGCGGDYQLLPKQRRRSTSSGSRDGEITELQTQVAQQAQTIAELETNGNLMLRYFQEQLRILNPNVAPFDPSRYRDDPGPSS